ncbi:MAG: hypothetical protein H7Z14_07060 [Anaerolineae bacterium]|nr:hypothetical protein [Phycisphaerae bacterium]
MEPPPPSLQIFLTLLVMLGGSIAMFALLVRRWTSRRQWLSLADWARQRRIKLRAKDLSQMPPPLTELERVGARLRLQLSDERMLILQFDTDDRESAKRTGETPESIEATPTRPRWNVLVRKLAGGRSNPAVALRPANLPSGGSVIDLFRLTAFHSLSNNRFAVLAIDAKAAVHLANSSARALLPADIGMLMMDQYLVLDFSTRPFDPVEMDRMISVAEQVCAAC